MMSDYIQYYVAKFPHNLILPSVISSHVLVAIELIAMMVLVIVIYTSKL